MEHVGECGVQFSAVGAAKMEAYGDQASAENSLFC